MKLDWSEPITDRGKPAVQSFLNRMGGRPFSRQDVAQHFSISEHKAAVLIEELLAREWIAPVAGPPGAARALWCETAKRRGRTAGGAAKWRRAGR